MRAKSLKRFLVLFPLVLCGLAVLFGCSVFQYQNSQSGEDVFSGVAAQGKTVLSYPIYNTNLPSVSGKIVHNYPVIPSPQKPIKRAVVCGLTAVNPIAYHGWSGTCLGCDLDANRFGKLCVDNGVETTILHNEQVTQANVIEICRIAVEGMTIGDLLILYISGHGGQIPDISGDEDDSRDETLCLYDGQMSDDTIAELLTQAPEGIRIWFITDTCNSGSNYRGIPFGEKIEKVVNQTPGFMGQLIHYGGCFDGKSSYGGEKGGAFTLALLKTYERGDQSYHSLFEGVKSIIGKYSEQIPSYAEFGGVTDEFRNARVFR